MATPLAAFEECCGSGFSAWAVHACRTGVCWDNALAEAFWSTFKNEYYHRHTFTTIAEARRGTYTWIDAWYNARRRHSKIGYLSPLQALPK